MPALIHLPQKSIETCILSIQNCIPQYCEVLSVKNNLKLDL